MKTCLAASLCAVLLLLPSAASAQDDFSGRWVVDMWTPINEMAVSPLSGSGSPVVLTQTVDGISWSTADGRQLAIRLSEPSVIAGRTYTARWVNRALLLEARSTLRDGSTFTMVQMLLRNANDDLELFTFLPIPQSNQGSEVGHLIYHRRK